MGRSRQSGCADHPRSRRPGPLTLAELRAEGADSDPPGPIGHDLRRARLLCWAQPSYPVETNAEAAGARPEATTQCSGDVRDPDAVQTAVLRGCLPAAWPADVLINTRVYHPAVSAPALARGWRPVMATSTSTELVSNVGRAVFQPYVAAGIKVHHQHLSRRAPGSSQASTSNWLRGFQARVSGSPVDAIDLAPTDQGQRDLPPAR